MHQIWQFILSYLKVRVLKVTFCSYLVIQQLSPAVFENQTHHYYFTLLAIPNIRLALIAFTLFLANGSQGFHWVDEWCKWSYSQHRHFMCDCP